MPLEKYQVFDFFYKAVPCVQIALRTDRGTTLPQFLKTDPLVTLSFGWGLLRPPPGFTYDDKGVRGHLSFSGNNHLVDVPWEAVIQITAHRDPQNAGSTCVGTIYWPEDLENLGTVDDKPAKDRPEEAPKKERPSWLKTV